MPVLKRKFMMNGTEYGKAYYTLMQLLQTEGTLVDRIYPPGTLNRTDIYHHGDSTVAMEFRPYYSFTLTVHNRTKKAADEELSELEGKILPAEAVGTERTYTS